MKKIAETLRRVALTLEARMKKLKGKELEIAKKFFDKGYKFCVQVTTNEGLFGEPLYFKAASEIGEFLRGFPDYQSAKIDWIVYLEEVFSKQRG